MEPGTRKILIRVIGAPLLLVALAAIVWLGHRAGTDAAIRLLVAAASSLGAWEFYALCRRKGHEPARIAGVVALAAQFIPWGWIEIRLLGFKVWNTSDALSYWTSVLEHRSTLILLVYVFCKLVVRWGRFTVESAALTVGGFYYLNLLRYAFETPQPLLGLDVTWWVLFLVATNKGSDMAAFCAGKLFGRHKMTPNLSPNKTWEGAIAGAAVGTAAGLAVIRYTPLWTKYVGNAHVPTGYLLFFAILVTIASQVGDLVESAIKRWAGAKDSGTLVPEFGGILDMADSFILSLPVAWLVSEFLYRAFR